MKKINLKNFKFNRFNIIVICVTFVLLLFFVSTFFHTYSDYVTRDPSTITGDTVYVNDLANDYYYLLGMNYVGDIHSNSVNYTESNIKMVTVNYYGYPSNDNNLTGYVSLTERQNKFVYYKYFPIVNNQISIELIDNPFILRPVGKGFGGWTSPNGTVTKNNNTNTYTLTVSSSVSEVNVYANWQDARVVFLKGENGDDNFDGSSDYNAVASWGRAFELLRNNNSNIDDRELNIIVLTGPLDHTINYTRRVTHTWNYSYTYTDNTSFTSGGEYLIEYKNGNNRYALYDNWSNVGMESLSTTAKPSDKSLWTITQTNDGYLIQNKDSGNYLGYTQYYNDQVAMFIQSTPYYWQYDSTLRTFFTTFTITTVDYSFSLANTLSNNTNYLIGDANSYTDNNGTQTVNALNNSLATTNISNQNYDESNLWRVNQSGTGYTIYNVNQNKYLSHTTTDPINLELNNTPLVWNYDTNNHTLSTLVTHYVTRQQYNATTLSTGTFYIGYQDGANYALLNNNRNFTNFNNNQTPGNTYRWTLEDAGNNSYYIKNNDNQYLRNQNGTLRTTTNSGQRAIFTLNNNVLRTGSYNLYRNGNSLTLSQNNSTQLFKVSVTEVQVADRQETQYLRFNNNNWRLEPNGSAINFISYTRNETTDDRNFYLRYDTSANNFTFDTNTSGTGLYFATYDENRTMTGTTRDPNVTSNNNYSSASNSAAATITSMYDSTDYRSNATLTLSSNHRTLVYRDLQLENLKVSSNGYQVLNDGATQTNLSGSYPSLVGNSNNVRIGRGMMPDSWSNTTSTIFTFMQGGGDTVGGTNDTNHAYKLVVESGRYSGLMASHIRNNYANTNNNYNYYGTTYLTMGCDYDRANNNDNSKLDVYYRIGSKNYNGINGTGNIHDLAYLMDIKSGSIGMNYFNATTEDDSSRAYSGVYVGGLTVSASNSNNDISGRVLIVEGGNIANINGGLRLMETTGNNGVNTKIYIKNGTIQNIVGGAGVSTTYGNRYISVTGGNIGYSVSAGSNGVAATNETDQSGRLGGDTYIHVGGEAHIGTASGNTLYGVKRGSVLGAGNGNEDYNTSGRVNTSHVYISGDAILEGNVYGGGNFGPVTVDSNITIDGGTIKGSVYGGANKRGVGTASINESTIYNVNYEDNKELINGNTYLINKINGNTRNLLSENSSSTAYNAILNSGEQPSDYSRWIINSSSNGYTIRNVNHNGYLAYTTGQNPNITINNNTTNAIWNYDTTNKTFYRDLEYVVSSTVSYNFVNNITSGSEYVLSSGNNINNTIYSLGSSGGATRLTTTSEPTNSDKWIITASGSGYTIRNKSTNQYLGVSTSWWSASLSYNTQTEWTWNSSNHQFTYTTGGWWSTTYYLRYNNGWELSTSSGSVYPATVSANTVTDTDRFYLVFDSTWKLSKTASSISLSTFTSTATTGYAVSNRSNGDVNITMNDGHVLGAIYGGACEEGIVAGKVTMNINGGSIGYDTNNNGSIFGGGYGQATYIANGVDLNINDDKTLTIAGTVYGGSALGTIIGDIDVDAVDDSTGSITVSGDVYCGSMGDSSVITTGGIQGDCSLTLNGGTYNGSVFGGNNANGSPTGVITVTTGGNYATSIDKVFAGGNQADITGTSATLNIENYSDINEAFGGGNRAAVTITQVNLHGGHADDIYGGSNASGNITTSRVNTSGGTADNIYGGNKSGGTTSASNVEINGGTIGNVYGGGKQAPTGTTSVKLKSGSVTGSTYGGGEEAGVTTSTNVSLEGGSSANIYGGSKTSGNVPISYITATSGSVGKIYGGNDAGGITSTTDVRISNVSVNKVYGGGRQATTGTSYVKVSSGTIGSVYGGGESASITTSATVDVEGGSITSELFGGSDTSGTVPVSYVNVTGGTIGTIFGGNNAGGTTTTTNVTVDGGTVTNIYGGGKAANSTTTRVWLKDSTNQISYIFGGCKQANATTTNVILDDGSASYVFGGSDTSGAITDSHVTVNGGTYGRVYGGNNAGGITSTTDVKILGGTAGLVFGGGDNAQTGNTSVIVDNATISNTLYGGGNNAAVTGNTSVIIRNSAVVTNSAYAGGNNGQVIGNTTINVNTRADIGQYLFGGGNDASVSGNTAVIIDNAVVRNDLFGGGNYGEVGGSTNVNIKDTVVLGSAYAGGKGTDADVGQNTTITVQGSSNISSHVFGGGNAGDTGTSGNNNSLGLVNITGATIGGNVYGGANTAVLYGETVVNIGYDAVTSYSGNSNNTYTRGNIRIGGTVFGGGEANEQGSETYDFDFISVTRGIIINIDGANHTSFNILGSIFGSGNASRTTGYSRIYMNNYGSESDIKNNVSLQRADLAVLNNVHMALSGATDRTNEYSQVVFSLSRITELDLKNSSELYLENGANLLTHFKSLNSDGTLAEVDINATTHVVDRKKGTNNRIYMQEDKVLNIALNQNVTAYGEVDGMTFFGMFKRDRLGNIVKAMYNTDYTTGSTPTEGELVYFSSGSYVLGLHETNHNIKVDGFYTNYSDPDNHGKILVDYITPSPDNAEHYMWNIGVAVQSYDIELIASKYSTLGTLEFPFINNTTGNTNFHISSFTYDELNPNVSFINPDDIPRIAATGTAADNVMGLAIKPGIGWVNVGSAYFLTDSDPSHRGLSDFKSENSNITPSFVFYLYHSKNLQTEGLVGTVVVTVEITTPIDDLTNHVEIAKFNITISRAIFDTNDYEGAMTPGREYQMFTSSSIMDITSKSSLSAYYSLYMESPQTIYRNDYHRVLTSNVMLPVNTKITMIDFASSTRPQYYYYIVNAADNAVIEQRFNITDEAEYPLSNFIRMGSLDTTNKYDDNAANAIYYDSVNHRAIEEFIFIVDFKDANISESMYDCSLLIDMIDNDHQVVHSVLGIQRSNMVYSLRTNQTSVIDVSANVSKQTLYAGDIEDLRVTINFNQNDVQSLNRIIDTTYYEQKLGLKITFINERGRQVDGVDLLGTSLTLDGKTHYASSDGTIRFKVSDKVANSYSNIRINTENSSLAAGLYTIKVEAFYSTDGIYFGRDPADDCTVTFRMMNKSYGLNVTIPDNELIIDHATGLNINNNRQLHATITYSGSLYEPNMKVSLYRRSYVDKNDRNYNLVDLTDYITNNVTSHGNNTKIYTILDELEGSASETGTNNYTFNFDQGLTTGTYKLEFRLYDDDAYVGNIVKYIIIK